MSFRRCLTCLFVLSCLSLSACNGQVRKPFCAHSLATVPQDLQGTYEVVVPAISAPWSGNMILKTVQIQLGPRSATTSIPTQGFIPFGQMCIVDGRTFLEQQNGNGTYSVSEIDKFPQGILLSQMSLDVHAARAKGFKLHYLPNVRAALGDLDGQSRASISFENGGFILDNTALSQQQMLSVMKALSFQVVLRSIPATTPLNAKGVLRLRD